MSESEITKIMNSLARIETKLEVIASQGADHETRIRELESKSGKKWDSVALSLLSAVIVAAIMYWINHA